MNSADTMFAPPAGTSVASLTTTLTGFGKGLDLPAGTPTVWVIPNLDAIATAYDIYCNCMKSGPAGGPGDFTPGVHHQRQSRAAATAPSPRPTRGGFLMADFETRAGRHAGARQFRRALCARPT